MRCLTPQKLGWLLWFVIAVSIQIHRAGRIYTIIAGIAIDASGRGTLFVGTYRQGIAISRQDHTVAEPVIRLRITRLNVGLLAPVTAGSAEQIHRAGFICTVIACLAIDASVYGILTIGTHH